MTLLRFMPRSVRVLIAGLVTALLLTATAPADAHAIRDETPRATTLLESRSHSDDSPTPSTRIGVSDAVSTD